MKLSIIPMTLEQSNGFVERLHRHHGPVRGHKFSIGVADSNQVIHGVAIVGRPVSRILDDGWTMEVTRCCTDGTPNTCSKLYRAAWRAASAMGYKRLVTYTLPEEGGSSLRGAGFRLVGSAGGGTWNRTAKSRHTPNPRKTTMGIQLADYDFVIVNTSSGKDSQTILRRIDGMAQVEGYPKNRIRLAHADLGRIEWPGTKELAEKQAAHYGLEMMVMKRPQGDILEHVEQRRMWPSSTTRFCTSDHKRGQIYKLFTRVVDEIQRGRKQVRILNVMGMRAEESPARAKLQVFKFDAAASNSKRHIDTWLPIHDWKIGDVWRDIKESGVPYHKAYDLGMPRLSCIFCIFSPPAALMIAGRHNPELLSEYVRVEKETGHTFRKDFPIEKVQQAIAAGEDWGKASDWVM